MASTSEPQTTVAGSTIAANGTIGLSVGSLDGKAVSVTNTTITGNDGSGIELAKGSAVVTLVGLTISGNGRFGLAEQGISESGASVSLGFLADHRQRDRVCLRQGPGGCRVQRGVG